MADSAEVAPGTPPPGLAATALRAGYGPLLVLQGVDLDVTGGQTVALLGHNGAGKSTLLKCLFGLLAARVGEVRLGGVAVTALSPRARIAAGMAYVPQVEEVFRDLTVRENIAMTFVAIQTSRTVIETGQREAVELFPALARLLERRAGTLSGGERKMLGVALALIRHPSVLLLDEPSAGLSPVATDELYERLSEIQRQRALTVLLAEQNVLRAVSWAQRTVILRTGQVHWTGPSSELLAKDTVEIARYL